MSRYYEDAWIAGDWDDSETGDFDPNADYHVLYGRDGSFEDYYEQVGGRDDN